MRKYHVMLLTVLVVIGLCGCAVTQKKTDKLDDVAYTIVQEENQPEEVRELIEANKTTTMKMSYTDQGKQYSVIGYGTQDTSGYSVEIREIYETENTIYIDTNLLGPDSKEEVAIIATYPYIVIEITESTKPIVYD